MVFQIYTPTDISEIATLFGFRQNQVDLDYELAEPPSLFSKASRIKAWGKEIVIRELTMKYGAELQKRHGMYFNPMSVLEIPDNLNHGAVEGMIARLVQEFGWVVSLMGLKTREHFGGKERELELKLGRPIGARGQHENF